MKDNRRHKKFTLLLLFLLYLSQGLPFGFQATALPVYLRMNGTSLTLIGFSGILALPWALKALWAPFIDRYYSSRFGKRKSWIVPMQICLVITIVMASVISGTNQITPLLMIVFFMNLFAATQDIAVDGLAVDLLGPKDLGPGNAAQVIGYKTGMVLSGGLLVYLSSYTGWQGLFVIMAGIAVIPLLAIFFFTETKTGNAVDIEKIEILKIFEKVRLSLKNPGAVWFILFIATYKIGELMIDVMFKPFLVDNGFTPSEIGLYIGTFGMAASLSGSFAGGMISARYPLMKVLFISAFLRIIPLCFEWVLTLSHPDVTAVLATTILEHFFGGMLTTVMFACMMSKVDRKIGATHYTILASIEVFGKSPGAWLSGPIAESMGYSYLFAVGILLSLIPLGLIAKLKDDKSV